MVRTKTKCVLENGLKRVKIKGKDQSGNMVKMKGRKWHFHLFFLVNVSNFHLSQFGIDMFSNYQKTKECDEMWHKNINKCITSHP